MKGLLILVALGLFLAAHGAVDFMSIYPQPALEDGNGGASDGNRRIAQMNGFTAVGVWAFVLAASVMR